MAWKTCKTCGVSTGKPSKLFYKQTNNPNTFQSDCKDCHNHKRKIRYMIKTKSSRRLVIPVAKRMTKEERLKALTWKFKMWCKTGDISCLE